MESKYEELEIGDYPYTYARVSAMRAKLFKKADYDKMLKMRESEIAKYLQDSEYKDEINKFGATLFGASLVERAAIGNLAVTLKKLREMSEGGLKVLVTEYLKKEDFYNIKTIIRGKYTKTSNDEIRSLFVPAGELDFESLNNILLENDIEKILEASKMTRYPEIKLALKTFKEKKHLEILEAAIDKAFYRQLVRFIDKIPAKARIIRDFLAGEVDVTNIKVILKFKREKVGEDVIKSLIFISRASKIPKDKWERIISAKSFEQAMKEFEKTPYEKIIKEGAQELQNKDTLSEIELALQRHLLERARKKTYQNPLSVDAILSYMFAKEIEIRNIHLIAKSKKLSLPESFIQKELIM